MGAVAGAEPAAELAGAGDGDATEVGADAEDYEPLGVLDADGVGLGLEGVLVFVRFVTYLPNPNILPHSPVHPSTY